MHKCTKGHTHTHAHSQKYTHAQMYIHMSAFADQLFSYGPYPPRGASAQKASSPAEGSKKPSLCDYPCFVVLQLLLHSHCHILSASCSPLRTEIPSALWKVFNFSIYHAQGQSKNCVYAYSSNLCILCVPSACLTAAAIHFFAHFLLAVRPFEQILECLYTC